MAMKPRITFNTTKDGELEIWVNEAGRDLLVKELQTLSERSDHFHFGAWEGAEVETSLCPYQPTDKIIWSGTVLFRPDAWDLQYFPHVLEPGPDSS
jgi:hypothetical protein